LAYKQTRKAAQVGRSPRTKNQEPKTKNLPFGETDCIMFVCYSSKEAFCDTAGMKIISHLDLHTIKNHPLWPFLKSINGTTSIVYLNVSSSTFSTLPKWQMLSNSRRLSALIGRFLPVSSDWKSSKGMVFVHTRSFFLNDATVTS
jgi:hypothetical protein